MGWMGISVNVILESLPGTMRGLIVVPGHGDLVKA